MASWALSRCYANNGEWSRRFGKRGDAKRYPTNIGPNMRLWHFWAV